MKKIALIMTTVFCLFVAGGAMAKDMDPCETVYDYPEGFGHVPFGATIDELKTLVACDQTILFEDDEKNVLTALGKIDKYEVMYEYQMTPKAKRVIKIYTEFRSTELFEKLKKDLTAQYGPPKITKARFEKLSWANPKGTGSLRIYRDPRTGSYKLRGTNTEFAMQEQMVFFCDNVFMPPDGFSYYGFGTSMAETLSRVGCGHTFVSVTDTELFIKGFAFNSTADWTLTFTSGDQKKLAEIALKFPSMAPFRLINNQIEEKYGSCTSGKGTDSLTWTLDGKSQILLMQKSDGTKLVVRDISQ